MTGPLSVASRSLLVAAVLVCLTALPEPVGLVAADDVGPLSGRILAPARGQVAWLDLQAPRPAPLTQVVRPAFAADVDAAPSGTVAVATVVSPFPPGGTMGGDLMAIDLVTNSTRTLLRRERDRESLDVPAIGADGSSVLFQRSDLNAVLPMPGQAQPQFQSRVERIAVDGSGPATVVLDDARYPAPSADGLRFAFVRTTAAGPAILSHVLDDGSDTTLVGPGAFLAIAYPRYSPDGHRLAFAAVSLLAPLGHPAAPSFLAGLFRPAIADAHGFPWEVWIANADGTNLHQVPDVMGDDPSVTWSPSGQSLLVYGGWGSYLVDVPSGQATNLPYLTGYGAGAWLAD